ncbi:hypothetical protein JOQ06_017599 [Pogonophryne albipinna]|uniref:Uncharacterized protein n=1 Tax=Pogonophryne albipinna TaxID=1090488 RepID=A0AAD6B4F9_9TELE|nr:hypothetical protein JOQ06_017599 [Pogonophryne albipinna]
MARHYSTQEALEIIMHSECEDGSSSSSEDSEADTEEASESTEDASEVGTDQLESNSDSSEAESGGEMEEAAKNGKVFCERKSRRQCHFCMDRRVCSTCCKCGNFTCKDHILSICSPCST